MAASVALSEKEQDFFKKAERLFQKRQYKQALKNIELVLRKNDKHGETLALKGAILGRTAVTDDEKAEALDVCKRGVGLDVTSRQSWTHLARLNLINMKYEDAIKNFKMAIKLCKPVQVAERTELRRNLLTLLAQVREWKELAELRRQMQIDNRDNSIVHLIGYMLAMFNSKQYEVALSALRDLRKSAPAQLQAAKEMMELNFLEARILDEKGDTKEALEHLSALKDPVNPLSVDEMCGTFELKLGKFSEARDRFSRLIQTRNSENYDYHRGLQSAIFENASLFTRGGVSLPAGPDSPASIKEKVVAVYTEMEGTLPKSMALQRIPLDFCDDAAFVERTTKFVRRHLAKGVPCLFAVLKALYTTRSELASKTFNDIANMRLAELGASPEGDAKSEKAYTLFFLAQNLDKIDSGCEAALATINQALEIEPKNADFLRFKARIFKHAGDFVKAFETIDSARQLELSDRYLNNKSAKYALRADKQDVALGLTHLFTRGEDMVSPPDPGVLHEYQCMWFELESAASYTRTGDIILALKNYKWVEKHFETVRDDEFDFHEYCIRHFVINSYTNLVRMEDTIRSARAFKRAAIGAVECWLRVADKEDGVAALRAYEKAEAAAKKAAEKASDESQFAGLTPGERKRAMKKIKEEKEKAEAIKKAEELKKLESLVGGTQSSKAATGNGEEEEEDGAAAEEPGPGSEDKQDLSNMLTSKPTKRRIDITPDPDPKGFKRFASLHKEPLKPAMQLLDMALAASPNEIELLVLAFDVHVRRRETTKAWSMLKRAVQVSSATAPAVFERLVPFARFTALSSVPQNHAWGKGGDGKFTVDDPTRAELDLLIGSLGMPVTELAKSNLSSNNSEVVLGSALGLLSADVDAPIAMSTLVKLVSPLKVATRVQHLLRIKDAKAALEHKQAAKKRWPHAPVFA